MDKNLLNYIVSPKTHEKLTLTRNRLYEKDGTSYKTVKNVPILLPEKVSADWHRELIEAVLWEYPAVIDEIYKEIPKVKDYSEVYIKHIKCVLKDKQGITDALERYSANDTAKWKVQNGNKSVSLKQKLKFEKYARKSTGKARTESKINGTGIFDVYPHFAEAVNADNPEIIVELGTGAGGGTAAAALSMKENARLFTVDIGFDCLGNAVGIARYQKKNIIPVCANFWYLPFADNMAKAVCTYNGLDESRENERTISEISRILKTDGSFVAVSRKNSFMRQARVLEPFGFTEEETVELMKKCRLYGDTETLDEICGKYNLHLKSRKEFERNKDLIFVLSVFEKK